MRRVSAADKRAKVFLVQEIRRACKGKIAPITIGFYEVAWIEYVKFATSAYSASHPRECLRRVFSPSALEYWFRHMIEKTDYSLKRIKITASGVRTAVRCLHEAGIVDCETWIRFKGVKLSFPKKFTRRGNRRSARKLSVTEVRRICDSVEPDTQKPRTLFRRAAILTLATTGLKTSELSKLKVENLREKNGRFCILGVAYYNRQGKRTVPLASEAYRAIQEWLAFRPVKGPYIFNQSTIDDRYELPWSERPIHPAQMGNIIHEIVLGSGVKDVTAGDIRNFVAARLAQKNVLMARKILGKKGIGEASNFPLPTKVSLGITEGILG